MNPTPSQTSDVLAELLARRIFDLLAEELPALPYPWDALPEQQQRAWVRMASRLLDDANQQKVDWVKHYIQTEAERLRASMSLTSHARPHDPAVGQWSGLGKHPRDWTRPPGYEQLLLNVEMGGFRERVLLKPSPASTTFCPVCARIDAPVVDDRFGAHWGETTAEPCANSGQPVLPRLHRMIGTETQLTFKVRNTLEQKEGGDDANQEEA